MKKILIVEDHPGMREALRRQIQSWGFAAITARNGKEGVETALKEKADLIMLDFMMPEMDGLQMTEILRSNPETKEVPIIAVTASFRRQDRQNCMGVGMQRLHSQAVQASRTAHKNQRSCPAGVE